MKGTLVVHVFIQMIRYKTQNYVLECGITFYYYRLEYLQIINNFKNSDSNISAYGAQIRLLPINFENWTNFSYQKDTLFSLLKL